jgi:rod shape-determining protein MreD
MNWNFRRMALIFALAMVANGVQSLLSPLWHYSRPFIDLPLLITILYANLYPTTGALFMGWLTGLFQDVFSGNALGINALSKLVVAYLVLHLNEKLEVQDLLPVQFSLLVLYVAIDGGIGYLAVTQLFQREWPGGIFSPNFIFSLLINPLVYLIFFYTLVKKKRRKVLGTGG